MLGGAPDEARRCALEALDVLGDDATVRWRAHLILAEVALEEGDTAGVRSAVAQGVEALGQGWGYVQAEFLALDAAACALSGALVEARRLRDAARQALGDYEGITAAWVPLLLSGVDIADGSPGPAVEALAQIEGRSVVAEVRWAARRVARWLALAGATTETRRPV